MAEHIEHAGTEMLSRQGRVLYSEVVACWLKQAF